MNQYEKRLESCEKQLRKRLDGFSPKAALVLGSGLGGLADELEGAFSVSYNELEGFPISTAPGHRGRFVFAEIGGVPTVVMQGRVHFYEGYPIADTVLPIRLMYLCGAKRLYLTNAAGGVNTDFSCGDLMLIRDHISFFVPSPLVGENIESLGVRFPDMSKVYSPRLCDAAKNIADANGFELREGVYAQTSGPNYETPAEIRMLRTLGCDAVGMSTVCEAMAARHCGMEICGISVITNMAAGILDQPLSHAEVQIAADKVAPRFKALMLELISQTGANNA